MTIDAMLFNPVYRAWSTGDFGGVEVRVHSTDYGVQLAWRGPPVKTGRERKKKKKNPSEDSAPPWWHHGHLTPPSVSARDPPPYPMTMSQRSGRSS